MPVAKYCSPRQPVYLSWYYYVDTTINHTVHVCYNIRWSTIDYPVSANIPVRKPPGGRVTTQVTVSKLPKLSHHVKQEKEEGTVVCTQAATFLIAGWLCLQYTVSEHLAPVGTKSTTEEPNNTESKQPAAKKVGGKQWHIHCCDALSYVL